MTQAYTNTSTDITARRPEGHSVLNVETTVFFWVGQSRMCSVRRRKTVYRSKGRGRGKRTKRVLA